MPRLHPIARLAAALAVAFVVSGCAVAPLVQDAGSAGPSVLDTVPDASPRTVRTDDGVSLHGALVEVTDPDAAASPRPGPGPGPVILHLLPSSVSVTTGVPSGIGRIGLAPVLEALRQRGYGSVVFDYRGVGGSEGSRDTARLLDDGRAMWDEAVRVAGGRDDQVIIRAGSIGTLIAADLLDQGARPAGVILYTPVRSSTIVRHAIASRHGRFWAALGAGLYRSPGAPDLVEVMRECDTPLLVVLATDDAYLPAKESQRVAEAARTGGHMVLEYPGSHQTTTLRAWNFVVESEGFGGRRADTLLPAEVVFLDSLSTFPAGDAEADAAVGADAEVGADAGAAAAPSSLDPSVQTSSGVDTSRPTGSAP